MEEHQGVRRRLAAILYADVAGYSRLTGADEEGTHRALGAGLDFVTSAITDGGGTVVHYAGDAVLAQFDSINAAAETAVAIQRGLDERAREVDEDHRLRFRIGLNIDDVIVDRGDIYGDGVNVAARLEALAEPGGIYASAAVFEQVHGKLKLEFEFLGPRQVKNIADPVQVYRLKTGVEIALPADAAATAAAAEAGPPDTATPASRHDHPARRRWFWRLTALYAVLTPFFWALNWITLPDFMWWQIPALCGAAIVVLFGMWAFRPVELLTSRKGGQ
ncbi:MAG: adenylate/guanylate cyclase domain-containing protein [Hyphomicrobiales bacterium]|nr:adenylate/guanylate cyclase domain-containing protein [Hyphomicrobiales bacterium]